MPSSFIVSHVGAWHSAHGKIHPQAGKRSSSSLWGWRASYQRDGAQAVFAVRMRNKKWAHKKCAYSYQRDDAQALSPILIRMRNTRSARAHTRRAHTVPVVCWPEKKNLS
jgi:hypothetical protein